MWISSSLCFEVSGWEDWNPNDLSSLGKQFLFESRSSDQKKGIGRSPVCLRSGFQSLVYMKPFLGIIYNSPESIINFKFGGVFWRSFAWAVDWMFPTASCEIACLFGQAISSFICSEVGLILVINNGFSSSKKSESFCFSVGQVIGFQFLDHGGSVQGLSGIGITKVSPWSGAFNWRVVLRGREAAPFTGYICGCDS